MPITINLPQGTNIGPGFLVSWSSTFVGPMPNGSFWRVRIQTPGEQDVMIQDKVWTFSGQNVTLGAPLHGDVTFTGSTSVAEGADVRLLIEFYQGGTSLPIETVSVGGLKWDTQTNAWNQVKYVNDQQTTVDLPFEDHQAIVTTEAAVTEELVAQTNPALRVALGALDLVLGFPTNRLAALECQHYTGRGALQRVSGPIPVDSYGLRWHFVSVPVDFGKRDGAVVEYIERILQLVKVNRDTNGNVYVEEVIDVFWDGGTMSWTWNNLPYEILYDVTPGCTVELCWLLL